MATDTLSEAIALLKAGNKAKAQKLLEPFIEANPQNIPAWMWEADTWPTLAGKIKVLEMCLQRNPDNQQVKLALAKLKDQQAPRTNSAVGASEVGRQEAPHVQSRDARLLTPQNTVKAATVSDQPPSPLQQPSPEPVVTPRADSVAAKPAEVKGKASPKLKPCPYCAEMIQQAAIVCRFCGRDLRTPFPTSKQENTVTTRAPAAVETTGNRPLETDKKPGVTSNAQPIKLTNTASSRLSENNIMTVESPHSCCHFEPKPRPAPHLQVEMP